METYSTCNVQGEGCGIVIKSDLANFYLYAHLVTSSFKLFFSNFDHWFQRLKIFHMSCIVTQGKLATQTGGHDFFNGSYSFQPLLYKVT